MFKLPAFTTIKFKININTICHYVYQVYMNTIVTNIKIVCRGAISLLLIVHWFISPTELLVFSQN